MANTGLRPDEAWNLEFRDVHVEDDYATRATILVIDVRGKVGVGYCKSMPGAVHPFEDLRTRREQKLRDNGKTDAEIAQIMPTLRVFPDYNRDLFNNSLRAQPDAAARHKVTGYVVVVWQFISQALAWLA